jgi:prepilin-type processing-associated H-X9-DG protein
MIDYLGRRRMTDKARRWFTRRLCGGFSLVEVMVVVSTVSVVVAVSIPALTTARSRAREIVCRSNLRQLVLVNLEYSNDHDGFCVPAASDLWVTLALGQGGYYRWHGKRDSGDEPFDPKKGPLAEYLADGQVKECPEELLSPDDRESSSAFEKGCGGYGYNMTYIGSRLWRSGITTFAAMKDAYAETTNVVEVRRPAKTLMFADTAYYKQNQCLVEYSFAEPPYFVVNGKPDISGKKVGYPEPSIHFRHHGLANIGWADGHIEPKPIAKMALRRGYSAAAARMNIGWFEPVDNMPFDLQ